MCGFFDEPQAVLLQGRAVVVVHVVQTEDGAGGHLFQQAEDQIGPYKAGRSCYRGTVKKVLLRIVVCRRGDDDEVRGRVGCGSVRGGSEPETAFSLCGLCQIPLDIIVLDRRDIPVQLLYLCGEDIDGGHLVVLCQEDGQRQAYIAGTGDGGFIWEGYTSHFPRCADPYGLFAYIINFIQNIFYHFIEIR